MDATEYAAVRKLAHSRTAPARAVERAQMVWWLWEGDAVSQVARRLGRTERRVRHWLKRFNELGLAGLADQPRSGRPPVYTPEEVAEVLATALTDPQQLGQPFGSWTLDRLQRYLQTEKGIGMKRSRIDEILLAEGLRWRTQESWFGEKATPVDPEFAEKRGASSDFTPPHQQAA